MCFGKGGVAAIFPDNLCYVRPARAERLQHALYGVRVLRAVQYGNGAGYVLGGLQKAAAAAEVRRLWPNGGLLSNNWSS